MFCQAKRKVIGIASDLTFANKMCDQELTSTRARHKYRMLVEFFSHLDEKAIATEMDEAPSSLHGPISGHRFLKRNFAVCTLIDPRRSYAHCEFFSISSLNFQELIGSQRHDIFPAIHRPPFGRHAWELHRRSAFPLQKAGTGRRKKQVLTSFSTRDAANHCVRVP